jgi:hypothetical protein
VAGCHRIDSFYYSCLDGTTGIVRLKEPLFYPVIPHRLTNPEEQGLETLLYFRKNQQLLSEIQPRVNAILTGKKDVAPVFPLLDLTVTKTYDISHPSVKLQNAPMEEVIATSSYSLSKAIPGQFIQSPEPQQIADITRSVLFVQVQGAIQRRDALILTEKRRDILNALEAFSRDAILSIVQLLASSSFDEALEVGHTYLVLLEANKKLDKFLDVGYFLLYPTIYDDPELPFRPLSQIDHSVRSRLRSILKEGSRLLGEILDYQAVLATAMVDQGNASVKMFEKLKRHDSFVSMFLCRVYLSLALSLGHWASSIIFAAQVAKDTDGFPFKTLLFDWLENEVRDRFIEFAGVICAEHFVPASWIRVVSEVIVVATHAQPLPPVFEQRLSTLIECAKDRLQRLLTKGESDRLMQQPPAKVALQIKGTIESFGKLLAQKGIRGGKVNEIMSIIGNAASAAPAMSS